MRVWPSTNATSSRKDPKPESDGTSAPGATARANSASDGCGAPRKTDSPAGANDEDRAKFAKLRDYLLRLDEDVTCKACGKKFEIPSQHSLMFVDQLAGLPNDEDLEREISIASGEPEPAKESKPALPPRFTRKSSGWK